MSIQAPFDNDSEDYFLESSETQNISLSSIEASVKL